MTNSVINSKILCVAFLLYSTCVLASTDAEKTGNAKQQVASALELAVAAKMATAEYLLDKGVQPKNNAEIGLTSPSLTSNEFVEKISVSEAGILIVFRETASPVIAGKTIVVEAKLTESAVSFRCSSNAIENEYLPEECD